MAKRISSIFQLGSKHPGHNDDVSRPRSAILRGGVAEDYLQSVPLTLNKSTPDLRVGTSFGHPSAEGFQAVNKALPTDPSRLSPRFSPTMAPPLHGPEEEDGLALLHPPPQLLRKPVPQQTGSPGSSRPHSRADTPRSRGASRDGSAPNSRAASPSKARPSTPIGEQIKSLKRGSWLAGGRGKEESQSEETERSPGGEPWIITPQAQHRLRYDLTPLANFQKIPELWNDACDTYIYLHARECGRGPSIKLDSSLFASSRTLTRASHGGPINRKDRRISEDMQHRRLLDHTSNLRLNSPESPSLSARGSSHRSSSTDGQSSQDFPEDGIYGNEAIHLCVSLPLQANLKDPDARLSRNDVEAVIIMRNLFAFLAGQPLVATSEHPSIFSILFEIANVLRRFEFTNIDGSTLGEEASVAFGLYVADFKLADVRSSREKTIEAMVLGERMKYWPLYNEGFVHAVGKYESLLALRSPKFHYIADVARKRMERAHLDLEHRLREVRARLEDLEFASMWAGVAQSKSSGESKGIHFRAWRSAFNDMRSHVLSFYKARYGSWPPKAHSKKNSFEEAGLNRLLLREVYADFSDLYDALVDRTSLTTRHMDIPTGNDSEDGDQEPISRALRKVLSEYDRSTPPVLPPVPFDTPRLPTLATGHGMPDLKAQKRETSRKLQSSEINLALLQSYNREHGQEPVKSTPFIDAFTSFERRCARGRNIQEMTDMRVGQWIFLYAVLQALPLVVVDAPDLKFTQGVEYFLCQVPRGSLPWGQDSQQSKQSWYGISGGSGVVSLPADVVEHGVDGIYRRSHCWALAEKWAGPTALEDGGRDSGTAASAHNPSSEYRNSLDPSIVHSPNGYYGDHNNSHSAYRLDSPRRPFVDDLLPPVMPGSAGGSRPGSRGSPSASPSRDRRGSLSVGLEQLPLPAGVSPTGSRPTSTFNPDMSFDKILAAIPAAAGKSEGKKTKKKQ